MQEITKAPAAMIILSVLYIAQHGPLVVLLNSSPSPHWLAGYPNPSHLIASKQFVTGEMVIPGTCFSERYDVWLCRVMAEINHGCGSMVAFSPSFCLFHLSDTFFI